MHCILLFLLDWVWVFYCGDLHIRRKQTPQNKQSVTNKDNAAWNISLGKTNTNFNVVQYLKRKQHIPQGWCWDSLHFSLWPCHVLLYLTDQPLLAASSRESLSLAPVDKETKNISSDNDYITFYKLKQADKSAKVGFMLAYAIDQ